MKLLVVSRGFPTTKYPLNGGFEFDQASALAAIGIEVVFFAIDLRSIRRKRKYGIIHGYEKGVNWYTISIPIGAIPLSWFCKLGSWALLFLFNRVFKNRTSYPDIIHAHFTDMGNIAAILANKENIPLVITEHSSAINEPIVAPEIIRCAKDGYLKATKVFAVSCPLAKNIYKLSGVRARVIPNMIKLDVFESAKKKKHKGFHIVSTGNLIYRKRFASLIKGFNEAVKNRSDIYLHIIGDGELKEELLSLAKDYGIENKITFHGYRNAEEIARIYEKCDCFALVSAAETFGVVYAEAMAAGLPVIATRCGGPEDFVNESNGLLVDVDSHEQLCNAIIKMYLERTHYSTDNIKRYVREHFSPNVIANQLLGEYIKILRDK